VKLEFRVETIAEKVEKIQIDLAARKVMDDQSARQMEEVKDVLGSVGQQMQGFSDKLGEYNRQLALHIAATQELRRHTQLLEARQEQFIKESTARMSKLEEPHRWAQYTAKVGRGVGVGAMVLSALYGLAKFLAGIGLF
jgi:uncharacterized protein with GYD domain